MLASGVMGGCSSSSGKSTLGAGGAASGGATSRGGSSGTGGAQTGGAIGSGGISGSGGQTGAGGVGTGGRTTTGGATGSGGSASGGATATGGADSGGRMAGGALGSGGAATGGATGTGGAGSGGKMTGGALGSGGVATGGTTGTGGAGSGGRMTGGTLGTGGGATGGASGMGGSGTGGVATGGAGGSGGTSGTSYRPCPTDGTACKIMPFGDSITDGYGVAGGYRVELFRRAHQAAKNITFVGSGSNGPAQVDGVAFPPNHEGHSGFTINTTPSRSGIAPLVATVMPTYTPHIVTLMIGTNDCIDSYDLANAPTRLGALIDSIFTQLPKVLIVVAQPIPSQDDALNQRLQTYNAAIPAVVKARADAGKHILIVDMYPVIAADPNYKTTLLQDTWHPNQAGHNLLGARWYEVLAGSL